MSSVLHRAAALAACSCLVLAGGRAAAQPSETAAQGFAASRLHADVEVDPVAYALAGYSVHVGLGWEGWRVDLGAFALRVPELVHGNADFEVSFDGYGLKLQYFPFEEQRGLFVGIDAGVRRGIMGLEGTELARRDARFNAGLNAGYRVELGAGFYVTPWLALNYAFGAGRVTLAGETLDLEPLSVLPLVHLGYHLR